ncbi:helix-turn-helix domain-containing protein [Streptomyces sp. NPDC101062]|uniref:helix-turn-helix domain-containing protein n=1 Tax=unclassified Streptomyces TaxID=2593676 RepID=UPI002E76D1A2|nr:helix-turn-helix transcriptional regulator [Streptomyces sp. JV176]MEE1800395.1 helix-turn-helix transcriptional regulator [Streptomyces sp. JV176]
MVRYPLAPEQIEAGRRLGVALRSARAGRSLVDVALAAEISPETLRKIETGRLPTPAFGTIVRLSEVLGVPLSELAFVWRTDPALSKVS